MTFPPSCVKEKKTPPSFFFHLVTLAVCRLPSDIRFSLSYGFFGISRWKMEKVANMRSFGGQKRGKVIGKKKKHVFFAGHSSVPIFWRYQFRRYCNTAGICRREAVFVFLAGPLSAVPGTAFFGGTTLVGGVRSMAGPPSAVHNMAVLPPAVPGYTKFGGTG